MLAYKLPLGLMLMTVVVFILLVQFRNKPSTFTVPFIIGTIALGARRRSSAPGRRSGPDPATAPAAGSGSASPQPTRSTDSVAPRSGMSWPKGSPRSSISTGAWPASSELFRLSDDCPFRTPPLRMTAVAADVLNIAASKCRRAHGRPALHGERTRPQ